MTTKRQHYVPQAYLRLFSEDSKHIWVYDKIKKKLEYQNIKDTGVIKHFYGSIRHPEPLDIPIATTLENEGISIIKKIDNNEKIKAEELGKLLNFISLQLLRTPAMKERIEFTFRIFWKKLNEYYIESGESNSKIEKIAEDFIKEQNIKNTTPKKLLANHGDLGFPKETFIDTIVGNGFKITEILSKQKWEILFAHPNQWLTSDSPFSAFIPNDEGLFPSLASDFEKIIPLSRKTLLVIDKEGFEIKMKQMLPWAIKVINLAIASKAKRYVYSGDKKLLEEIIKTLPEFELDPTSFTNRDS